jgi:hypothetical protein
MIDQFRSRDRIGRVEEPVLIVHGARDRVVPIEHGWRLNRAAAEPKLFVSVGKAGHNDLWDEGLWAIALRFLGDNGVTSPQVAP